MKDNNRVPKIGEIYLMNFSGSGSEQSGWRPGLVFQNNKGNKFSPNIIALPLTSAIKKLNQPTHVLVSAKGCGLSCDSLVLCENPERMSKERVGRYLTTLPNKVMSDVVVASLIATSAIGLVSEADLLKARKKAVAMNAAV